MLQKIDIQMAKKIHTYFRDAFEPGEWSRLAPIVTRTLRAEFPDFIVHTDVKKGFRENFIVYVYGLWRGAEGEAEKIVDAAFKTVERLLSNVSWRKAYQPTPPPPVELPLPAMETPGSSSTDSEE